MDEKNMKCPFRVDRDGEYEDCYGPACMAYYEYKPAPITFGQTNSIAAEQPPVAMCRKMVFPAYGCGCN